MREADLPSNELEGLPPPLAELPWSSAFVMQAIEILPVAMSASRIVFLKPAHAESLVVGWAVGERPEQIAAQTLARLGLQPTILHSTSWRHRGEEVVLTYLATLEDISVPDSWEVVPVGRAELARGDKTAPPPVIGILQVLEHALRHLAWLVKDDSEIQEAIPHWKDVLAEYTPEPFRELGEGK